MKQKVTIDSIFCILFMTIYTCPYFTYLLGSNYVYVSAVFMTLWLVSVVLTSRGKLPLRNKYCLTVCLYIVIFNSCAVLGVGDAANAFAGYTVYWFFAFIPLFYIYQNKKRQLSVIIYAMLSIIGFTAVTTIMAFARMGVQSKLSTVVSETVKNQLNVGQYNYINGIAILFTVTIAAMLHVKDIWKKVFFGVLSLLIAITCLISGYTIAFLTMCLSYVLYIIKEKKNKMTIRSFIIIVIVILMLLNLQTIVNIISEINPHLGLRLGELINASGTPAGDGDLDSRINLMTLSFKTFLENPLFGVGPYINRGVQFGIGEHSQILDDMARFGIISVILYISFIKNYLKVFSSNIPEWYGNALTTAVIVFSAMCLLDPTFMLPNMGMIFLVIIPGLGFVLKDEKT